MMVNKAIWTDLHGDALLDKIREFGHSRITVMFDSENYLFFDYPCNERMDNVMAIETFDGHTIFVPEYNCGYRGTGPGKTERFLISLGVEKEDAKKLAGNNGFQICFDEKGRYLREKSITGFPFESRAYDLSESNIRFERRRMVANLAKKQLYFIEPAGTVYLSFLRVLDKIEVKKMHVYIGEHNYNYFDFSMPYVPHIYNDLTGSRTRKALDGPFILFQAKPFDVICYLGERNPVSMINACAVFLMGKPVFYESRMGYGSTLLAEEPVYRQGKLTDFRNVIKLIKRPEEIYRTFDIENKEKLKRMSDWHV